MLKKRESTWVIPILVVWIVKDVGVFMLSKDVKVNYDGAYLTSREIEVVSLIAQGLNNTAISERLDIHPKTVENHANILYSKLNIQQDGVRNSRVRAVLLWQEAVQNNYKAPFLRPGGRVFHKLPYWETQSVEVV